jgi:hypothetical protein
MATAETCPLSPSHPPKPASLRAFTTVLPTIKHELTHLRHTHNRHEPSYFAPVRHFSDAELTSFSPSDLVAVRVGKVAYGIIEFGKVRIPGLKVRREDGREGQGYVFVRWFVGGEDEDRDGEVESDEVEYKFHSFYTEEREAEEGKRVYRAIMGEEDVSLPSVVGFAEEPPNVCEDVHRC